MGQNSIHSYKTDSINGGKLPEKQNVKKQTLLQDNGTTQSGQTNKLKKQRVAKTLQDDNIKEQKTAKNRINHTFLR